MFVKKLPLQWWSKKLTLVLMGVQGGKNHGFRGYFEVQATFLPARNHQPHQTCRKCVFQCFTTSHEISRSIFCHNSPTPQACKLIKVSEASKYLLEYFKSLSKSLTPVFCFLDPKPLFWSQFFWPAHLDPLICPSKRPDPTFCRKDPGF